MTATAAEIQEILDYPRNGANEFYRHWFMRRFIHSDGVNELAEKAGCFWLIDLIATECAPLFLKLEEPSALIKVTAKDGRATMCMDLRDDHPPVWVKRLEYADLPDCSFTLLLGYGDEVTASLILLSEY